MKDIHIVDSCLLIVAHVIPIYIVCTRPRYGVILGGIAYWFVLLAAGLMLSALDPNRSSILDAIWLVVGLPAGLAYCGIVYLIKRAIVARTKANKTLQ